MITDDTKDQYVTLESYERGVQRFVDKTPPVIADDSSLGQWIQFFLSQLQKEDEILEIGTGTGKDADYMESHGYHVTRSDAVDGFIEMNRQRGKEIIKLNVLDFDFTRRVQWVFADMVLLHFTKQQCREIVQHIASILPVWGVFAFSMKKGEWSEIEETSIGEPRFFQYWHEDDLKDELWKLWFTCLYETLSEGRTHMLISLVMQKI